MTDNVQNASIELSIGSSEGKQFNTIFDFLQGIWQQLNTMSTQIQDVKTAVNDNLDSGLVNISEWLGMGKESYVPNDEEYSDATLVEKMNYLQEKLKNTQSNPVAGAGAEPLNFNNYITDISTFGADSYVLDPENSDMWYSLLANSLAMFGHKAIHDVVYERLTDADVDYLLLNNQRLGQTFNSFYKTDVFVDGGIDTILRSITPETYNKLEHKLQSGINRYVSLKTSGENAGEWLSTIFDKAELSSKTTIASVVRDTNFWNSVVFPDESLRFVVCLSVSADEFMSSNSDSSIYISFIETVAQSTDATMTLINALADTEQLNTFFANERVCNAIANSVPSMTTICYNTDGFAAMISSETAMEKIAASEVAINVILEAIIDVINSKNTLDGLKTDLTSIETKLPNIKCTEPIIAEVADTKNYITNVITSLQTVISKSDILVSNVDTFLSSETAMNCIANSDVAMNSIINSPDAMSGIVASKVAMSSIIDSPHASRVLNVICKNSNHVTNFISVVNSLDANKVQTALKDTNYFTTGQYLEINTVNNPSSVLNNTIYNICRIGAHGSAGPGYVYSNNIVVASHTKTADGSSGSSATVNNFAINNVRVSYSGSVNSAWARMYYYTAK